MRCFYVLKKWSSAKLSLNWDLSLNKMSLNRDCTVLYPKDYKNSNESDTFLFFGSIEIFSNFEFLFFMDKANTKLECL